MIKRYINLTIYILILLTIVIIISRRGIIERYVDINKFGSFRDCDTSCDDGKELKECQGLNSGTCGPCRAGTAGTGGVCNINCANNQYSNSNRTRCITCGNGKRVNSSKTGCEPCPAGWAGTRGTCNRCYGNTYTWKSGLTKCYKCYSPKTPNLRNTACVYRV